MHMAFISHPSFLILVNLSLLILVNLTCTTSGAMNSMEPTGVVSSGVVQENSSSILEEEDGGRRTPESNDEGAGKGRGELIGWF